GARTGRSRSAFPARAAGRTRPSPGADIFSRRIAARSWREWWSTSWRAHEGGRHGRDLPHLRLGAVAVLDQGALLLPLQGHPARVAGADHPPTGRGRPPPEAAPDPPPAAPPRGGHA